MPDLGRCTPSSMVGIPSAKKSLGCQAEEDAFSAGLPKALSVHLPGNRNCVSSSTDCLPLACQFLRCQASEVLSLLTWLVPGYNIRKIAPPSTWSLQGQAGTGMLVQRSCAPSFIAGLSQDGQSLRCKSGKAVPPSLTDLLKADRALGARLEKMHYLLLGWLPQCLPGPVVPSCGSCAWSPPAGLPRSSQFVSAASFMTGLLRVSQVLDCQNKEVVPPLPHLDSSGLARP